MVSYFLYVVLLLCRYDYLFCSARDTLTHADPLIDDRSETLVSAGGKFELGFFTPPSTGRSNSGGDGRYVGIWYHNMTPTTVVWVANREHPVPANSTGRLTIDEGNLCVLDSSGPSGNIYWSTNIGKPSSFNMTLKIMESGNLVLMESDQMGASILWQSFQNFQNPTDTFIPGMLMDKSFELTSWRKENDPGVGNFTFKLDQSEKQYIIFKKSVPYWKSGEPGNHFSSDEMRPEVAYMLSNFTDTRRQSSYTVRSWDYKYKRLVLNSTGSLNYLSWYENKKQWLISWSEPRDQCSVFNPCGKFGSCNINNWPLVCKCLPGFKPLSPDNWDSGDFSDGCYRQSLLSDNNSTFLRLKMMKVGEAESQLRVDNETICSNNCLANPQCQAYSVAEDRAKRGPITITTSNFLAGYGRKI